MGRFFVTIPQRGDFMITGETKILAKRKYFTIDLAGPDSVVLSVYRYDLCDIINRAVKKYPGYRFQPGEELQVRLDVARQLQSVASILNIEDLAKQLLTQLQDGTLAKAWTDCL